mmetsp:Transcript_20844/g.40886  ORF Transcript_20844/g.40886 Transcript_20844/m.40886 type:complete len:292 (-) Transcript_20844:485-1360(-)
MHLHLVTTTRTEKGANFFREAADEVTTRHALNTGSRNNFLLQCLVKVLSMLVGRYIKLHLNEDFIFALACVIIFELEFNLILGGRGTLRKVLQRNVHCKAVLVLESDSLAGVIDLKCSSVDTSRAQTQLWELLDVIVLCKHARDRFVVAAAETIEALVGRLILLLLVHSVLLLIIILVLALDLLLVFVFIIVVLFAHKDLQSCVATAHGPVGLNDICRFDHDGFRRRFVRRRSPQKSFITCHEVPIFAGVRGIHDVVILVALRHGEEVISYPVSILPSQKYISKNQLCSCE